MGEEPSLAGWIRILSWPGDVVGWEPLTLSVSFPWDSAWPLPHLFMALFIHDLGRQIGERYAVARAWSLPASYLWGALCQWGLHLRPYVIGHQRAV